MSNNNADLFAMDSIGGEINGSEFNAYAINGDALDRIEPIVPVVDNGYAGNNQIQNFDFSVDLMRSILWQYNDATRLQALLQQKQDWYDVNQKQFWENWIKDVFDLRTANDFGLAVWAIILDISLSIPSTGDPIDKPIWGFGEYRKNFTNGNFANAATSGLTTEQRRLLLQLRYFQLVTRATVPEINAFVSQLFAEYGPVYVLDGLDMTATYIFGFSIPSEIRQVITEFDLLPRPAAVQIDIIELGTLGGFGFGQYHQNFTNGNFYHA